jgi:hypothetical protein
MAKGQRPITDNDIKARRRCCLIGSLTGLDPLQGTCSGRDCTAPSPLDDDIYVN